MQKLNSNKNRDNYNYDEYKSDKTLDWKGKCCPLRGVKGNMRAPICNAGQYRVTLSNDINCFTYCRDEFKQCSVYKKAGKNPFKGENEEVRRKIMKKKEEKKEPKKCGCGCGGTTKGGEFLPGHDARHKGNLKKTYLEKKGKVRDDARHELLRRKWGLLEKKKMKKTEKKTEEKKPKEKKVTPKKPVSKKKTSSRKKEGK